MRTSIGFRLVYQWKYQFFLGRLTGGLGSVSANIMDSFAAIPHMVEYQ